MKNIWILVYVYHGLIQEPEVFIGKTDAMRRKQEILKRFSRDYDEVEIFPIKSPVK